MKNNLMKELLPTQELIIKEKEWEGYSLWKYIKLFFPYYTKLLIIKELRLKHILVNSKASYFQYKLELGDIISILVLPKKRKIKSKHILYIKPEILEKFKKKQILFENENLLLLNKLAGQIVQNDCTSSSISIEQLIQELSSKNSLYTYKTKAIHRLDKPVSGLLMCAKNIKAHNLLSEALQKRELTKLYLALIIGKCNFKSKTLAHWIDDKGIKVKIQENSSLSFKYSESKVTKLKSFSNLTLVELHLITGRKNQLRAQLAYINLPILGDRKYYSENTKKELKKISNHQLYSSFNSSKIALISYKLRFPNYLVKELELPWKSFTLPEEKNIILNSLKSLNV